MSSHCADQVTQVVEILGCHSLSVKELKEILSYLYAGQNRTWVSERWREGGSG